MALRQIRHREKERSHYDWSGVIGGTWGYLFDNYMCNQLPIALKSLTWAIEIRIVFQSPLTVCLDISVS